MQRQAGYGKHGYHEVGSSGNLLKIEAWGPWNKEAALDFDAAVRLAVRPMLGAAWGMLARLHGEGLYTPESLPIITNLHLWRIASGMRTLAIVHDRAFPEVAHLTEFQFNKVYAADPDGLCAMRYFFDADEALAWLAEAGCRG
jgi:hypothetical protein